MTAAHNAARATVSPAASPPLPCLSWDAPLATGAQSWATALLSRGACTGTLTHSGTTGVGENIALMPTAWGAADAVEMWDREGSCYNRATNTCSATCSFTYRGVRVSPNTCGHYTQVAWRDTLEVGCGVADCPPRAGYAATSVWVCQYSPPGNRTGRAPY